MATIGTYRSNSSASTSMLVEWTSLSATQIRINTTYMLGSSTGLYTGNSRNLVVEIRSSAGVLLGSADVEVKDRYTSWYASTNYYGQATITIPYQSGGTLKVTVKTVVGAYSTGIESCLWDATAGTNYPSQVSISWPVYNTAPYWGSAAASLNLSGTIPENTSSLTVTWGSATDDQNDTLYYDVYRVSSLGTTKVASGLTIRSFTDNIGAGNQGAWYEYQIKVNDGSLWASSPEYITSNRVTKNVFTKATLASSASVAYASTGIAFTWSGAANTNGNATFTYKFSSGDITIYNASVPVTGSSYTLPIYKTGTAPSGPYIKFADIKAKFAAAAYKGTLTFTLTTTNAYGSSGTSNKAITVNIQTEPATFSVNAPTGTYTIAGSAYFIPDRKAISLSWAASSDLLGGSVTYDVQVSLAGAGYETVKSGLTGTSTSVTFSQVSAATSCIFRVVAKTSYGTSRTVTASTITLHYYLPPTITVTGLDRQTTSVAVTATVGFRSSIAGAKTVTAASFIGKSGTATSLTPGTGLVINEVLTEAQTYTMTITAQDAGGVGVGTAATSVTLIIPKYAPMLSLREKGVAINDVADSDAYIFKVKGKALIYQDNAGISGLVINVASGQPPLEVNSNVLVNNLNADLIDGIEGASLLRKDAAHISAADGSIAVVQNSHIDITNLSNAAPEAGFPSNYGQIIYFAGETYGRDFAFFKTNSAYPTLYVSGVNSARTGFQGWNKVWTEYSDGPGSGLDADTVDGLHASAFSAADHVHSGYLDKVAYVYSGVQTYRTRGGYNYQSPPTGALVIDLGTDNIMFHAEISIRSYNYSAKIYFSGYTYVGSANWHSTAAYGIVRGNSALRVRFMTDGANGKRYVVIGETTTSFGNYLEVSVDSVTKNLGDLTTTFPMSIKSTGLPTTQSSEFTLYRENEKWTIGDANFAAGSGTVTSSWTSVSFGRTFSSPPKVVPGYAEDFSGDSGILKVRNVTTTGFEWVIGGSFTSRNANWLAILI